MKTNHTNKNCVFAEDTKPEKDRQDSVNEEIIPLLVQQKTKNASQYSDFSKHNPNTTDDLDFWLGHPQK